MTQKYTLNPSERFQVRILVGLQISGLAILRLRGSKLSIDYGVWGTEEWSTALPERGLRIMVRIHFNQQRSE